MSILCSSSSNRAADSQARIGLASTLRLSPRRGVLETARRALSAVFVCSMCYVAVFSSLDEALYNIRAAQRAVSQVAAEPSAKQSVDYEKILKELKKIEIVLINSGK